MGNIIFDKPRSITPESILRELRESPHCHGMEILLWDEEITIEDRKSGLELTLKLDNSKVELEAGGTKKTIAEKVAKALVGQGLRRRPPPGQAKEKKVFPRRAGPAAPPPSTPPPASS